MNSSRERIQTRLYTRSMMDQSAHDDELTHAQRNENDEVSNDQSNLQLQLELERIKLLQKERELEIQRLMASNRDDVIRSQGTREVPNVQVPKL